MPDPPSPSSSHHPPSIKDKQKNIAYLLHLENYMATILTLSAMKGSRPPPLRSDTGEKVLNFQLLLPVSF